VALSQSAGWLGVQYRFVGCPEGADTMSKQSPSPEQSGIETRGTETVEMTTADQVAQYLIEDQMADLTDAVREAV
jgi:hypothetical protein